VAAVERGIANDETGTAPRRVRSRAVGLATARGRHTDQIGHRHARMRGITRIGGSALSQPLPILRLTTRISGSPSIIVISPASVVLPVATPSPRTRASGFTPSRPSGLWKRARWGPARRSRGAFTPAPTGEIADSGDSASGEGAAGRRTPSQEARATDARRRMPGTARRMGGAGEGRRDPRGVITALHAPARRSFSRPVHGPPARRRRPHRPRPTVRPMERGVSGIAGAGSWHGVHPPKRPPRPRRIAQTTRPPTRPRPPHGTPLTNAEPAP